MYIARVYRVMACLRQVELREQLLLGELVEERAFPAPENIRIGPSLPLDDATIGHRRAGREGACLHIAVPSFLRVLGELSQSGVCECPGDRGDEDQVVPDVL